MLRVKKQISSDEHLARLQEDTARQIEKERVPGQDDFEKLERQKGHPLSSGELLWRVSKMNSRIWPEEKVLGRVSLFYSTREGEREFTGAHFPQGVVWEFSQCYPDLAGRPVRWEYGWRVVLHRLMQKGLITWRQIKKLFPIYESTPSAAFDRQTRELKERI
jgi:hypothetical protein